MKNVVVIMILVLVAIGGFSYFQKSGQAPDSAVVEMSGADEQAEQSTGDTKADGTMVDEKYLTYSPEVFAAAEGRRLLFFFASWCPTCKPVDAGLSANQSEIPDDVTIFRVNYNDPDTDEAEKALARQYNVTYQHTFVQVDADGAEVAKWNGGSYQDALEKIQ